LNSIACPFVRRCGKLNRTNQPTLAAAHTEKLAELKPELTEQFGVTRSLALFGSTACDEAGLAGGAGFPVDVCRFERSGH